MGKKSMGFGVDVASKVEKNLTEIYKNILPEDLLKYGAYTGVRRQGADNRYSAPA